MMVSKKCPKCGEVLRESWYMYCGKCYPKVKAEAAVRVACFRLTIELVPSTSWYSNLRNSVKPGVWDVIRHKAYAEAGNRCSICGYQGKLFCHERWLYDDGEHVQKLGGFVAVCQLCHMVKHIGYAGLFFDDYRGLIEHFKRVNNCSYEDFLFARAIAFDVWEERSKFKWVQELGEYANEMVVEPGGVV